MLQKARCVGNDQITMTAPLPVCSAKLSIVEPGQYYGGGPRWNPGCCSLFFSCVTAPQGQLLFRFFGCALLCWSVVFRHSIVASIPACHAGDRGSIPRVGGLLFLFCSGFIASDIFIQSAVLYSLIFIRKECVCPLFFFWLR